MKINYTVKKTIVLAFKKVVQELEAKDVVISFESEAQLAEFLVENKEYLLNDMGAEYEDYYAEKICKKMDDTSDGIYLRFRLMKTKNIEILQEVGFNFTKAMYLERGIPVIPLKDLI